MHLVKKDSVMGDESEGEAMITNPEIALDVLDRDLFPRNPFSEKFDADFWKEVSNLYEDGTSDKNWSVACSEVRVNNLIKKYQEKGINVIVGLMEDIYDIFQAQAEETKQLELMPSFIQQFSEFVNIILNKDIENAKETGKKSVYSKPLKCKNGVKMTVLHLVAERNLNYIGHHIVDLYPGQCYIKSAGPVGKKIPLEIALEKRMDATSAMLVKAMLNERVRELFEYDEAYKRSKFSFSAIAQDKDMKQTALAILDCLINPDFPYVPVPPGQQSETAWSKIPDMPMRYHVYYRLLDGDGCGRPARIKNMETGHYKENPEFDHISSSGLYVIANSPFNSDIVGHPAIRLLIQKKWKEYGANRIRMYAVFYLFFLLLMTLAFFLPTQHNDRSTYSTTIDKFRGLCEIMIGIISFIYLISEIDQMFKEKWLYWMDVFNYLDLFGLACVLLIIPIKWSTVDMIPDDPSVTEWSLASLAYLVNFLRLFKYFPAYKQIGVYSKTFADIFYNDISKFFILYLVVMGAFTGCVILAIKATATGLAKANMTESEIFLQEIRALTEGQGFADSYIGNFRTTVILLLMINMFGVIVMLTNILIGQLSYRYENALLNARVQYDIDKTKLVTKLENSRFRRFNSRINNYVDAAYINETDVVNGLLDDWRMIKSNRTKQLEEESVRDMMKDMLKKKAPKLL